MDRLRQATAEDALVLSGNLRPADQDEVYAATGLDVNEAMVQSHRESSLSWVFLSDGGEPYLICGVAPCSTYHHVGVPWLLATEEITAHKLITARLSAYCVGMALKEYALLVNWVDARNAVSIRWLEWNDFYIEEPKPYGHLDYPFHRFWRKRDIHV